MLLDIIGSAFTANSNKKAAKQYAAAADQAITGVNAGRDMALAYQQPTYDRGQLGEQGFTDMLGQADPGYSIDLPQYGAEPDYGAYGPEGTYSADEFRQNDPGYDFAQQEANKMLRSSYGQRGIFMSGDAAKGLQRDAEGIASQRYDSWRNFAAGRYDAGYDRFSTDRGFKANRYDAGVDRQNDLYRLADNERGFTVGRADERMNRLAQLAGWGQDAGANIGQIYGNAADNVAKITTGKGEAQAGATAANGRVWGNTMANISAQAQAAAARMMGAG